MPNNYFSIDPIGYIWDDGDTPPPAEYTPPYVDEPVSVSKYFPRTN